MEQRLTSARIESRLANLPIYVYYLRDSLTYKPQVLNLGSTDPIALSIVTHISTILRAAEGRTCLLGRARASPTLAVHLCSRDMLRATSRIISWTKNVFRILTYVTVISALRHYSAGVCMYVTSSRRTYMLQHVYSLQLAASARL